MNFETLFNSLYWELIIVIVLITYYINTKLVVTNKKVKQYLPLAISGVVCVVYYFSVDNYNRRFAFS